MHGFATPRRLAAALTAAVISALLLPATSPAAAGSLDRSFHGNGRLVIKATRVKSSDNPFEVTRLEPPPVLSAPGPKGELVIARDGRVLRYRADGRPRKRFGGDGRAAIPTWEGMSFRLAGLAVDSRGRVLVAGTTMPAGATGGSLYARVSVYRFMLDGKLDRSFGEGGVAGTSLGPMHATGLAVDSLDRPVLSGVSALTPSFCNQTPVYLNTTVIARLTARGAPDPTFGEGDGTFTDPLEDAHLPTLSPNRQVVYVSVPEQRCDGFAGHEFGHIPMASILTPGGDLFLRFPFVLNTAGVIFDSLTSLAVDRRNRIVILTTSGPPEGGGISQQLSRLLPDGSPDPEFGRYSQSAGTEPAPGPPGGRFFAVTTDARNRIILAGSAQRHEGRLVPHGFLATRLNAAGKTQTWFGRDGAAKVAFGKLTDATATQVHVDSRGRIVLGGTVITLRLNQTPTGYGLAFARLLSGRR
ncbi:MAG TPA: hypothetical protein VFM51_00920 [Solirubrobacterales bacterium]|nr:hypothetical protein [Solirubrobacterales bacterium]